MKVIVDANIVFSAILNTNGKIGDLLLNSGNTIEFFAPKYMIVEVTKYHNKIKKITGMSHAEINKTQYKVTKKISFISENQIANQYWIKAEEIVRDVDLKDTPYLAYSFSLGIKIWTGDLELKNGLEKKGFYRTILTNELYEFREGAFKS